MTGNKVRNNLTFNRESKSETYELSLVKLKISIRHLTDPRHLLHSWEEEDGEQVPDSGVQQESDQEGGGSPAQQFTLQITRDCLINQRDLHP